LAVKLRLRRFGKKKQPFYRIVAIDSRSSRDSSYLDKVGHYNPVVVPAEVVIDKAKAFKWLDNGATPSDTVKSLFRRQGILMEWTLKKNGADDTRIAEEMVKWQAAQVERAKKVEAKAAQLKREQAAAKKKSEESAPAEEKAAE
jgi:small subunit ribosomal protein S16